MRILVKKEWFFMDYINAFWVGGLICALTQILMEKTKLMPGRIMVLLVFSGAVLGAAGSMNLCLITQKPEQASLFLDLEMYSGKASTMLYRKKVS